MPDAPRPVATSPDSPYSLTIEEAAGLYAKSGHPRTLRTVQRYCASGHLDCVKAATLLGDKYFVEPVSIARHIAQIDELIALDHRAHGPGVPRQGATAFVAQQIGDTPRLTATVMAGMPASAAQPIQVQSHSHDVTVAADASRPTATDGEPLSRPDAAAVTDVSQHVAQLEREVERLSEDRTFLRQQIATKDEQIASLLERDRETNILVRGLQQMLSPLLGGSRSQNGERRFE